MATDITVAVAGATGAMGGEVLKVLDAARWRPARVVALARATTSTTHVDYGDERVPVDDASDADLGGVEALVVAVPVAAAADIVARGVAAGVVVIDVSGVSENDAGVPLVVPWVNPEALAELHRGVVALPDPIATLLASVLGPLRRAGVDAMVDATVFVPASREGKAGIDELSRQVVALFNSATPPRKVFKEGLAFDLIPAIGIPEGDGSTELERRVAAQTARLTGLSVTITAVGVPVFSGVSASIGLTLNRPVNAESILRILADGGVRMPEAVGTRYLPRPRRVEGHAFAHVGRVRVSPDGHRVTIWASMDNLRTTAAAVLACLGSLLRVGASAEPS